MTAKLPEHRGDVIPDDGQPDALNPQNNHVVIFIL